MSESGPGNKILLIVLVLVGATAFILYVLGMNGEPAIQPTEMPTIQQLSKPYVRSSRVSVTEVKDRRDSSGNTLFTVTVNNGSDNHVGSLILTLEIRDNLSGKKNRFESTVSDIPAGESKTVRINASRLASNYSWDAHIGAINWDDSPPGPGPPQDPESSSR